MWLLLAFLSATLLGFYDSFKKKALSSNAVIPVLFLNTVFSSLIFIPFIILSYGSTTLEGSIFHVASGGWEVHNAYWEFIPTVDHIYPVALGGADSEENWATTSMLHNSIKNNWTLEQLNWELYDAGNYEEWDGLTALFIELVNSDKSLLEDSYIKKWYKLSCLNVKGQG